jgi:hypothetical protein
MMEGSQDIVVTPSFLSAVFLVEWRVCAQIRGF